MNKLFALCMICTLPFLVGGCGDGPDGNHVSAQEQTGGPNRFSFESDYMSMVEIGEMLEQMGREIQQNGAVTFAGDRYPLSGHGGIEFNINRRSDPEGNFRTGLQMDFGGDGSSDPPTARGERKAYTLYEGAGLRGTSAEIADALDEVASTLESTGTFAWDSHAGDFFGTALVDQILGQNTRNPRQPYQLMLDITFGEGEFERHGDREDIEEAVERDQGVWLGNTSVEGADQAEVVEALRALGAAVRSGQLVIGEGEVEMGDSVSLNFGHVAAFDGSSEKVEMGLSWSALPPPDPQERVQGPRYSEEPWAMPMSEFAGMLQRIATEILEDGTFMLEGEEVTVGETVGGEISFGVRGMAIEVGWNR